MTCCWKDCGADARWYPVMLLYADRRMYPHGKPARSIAAIPVCDEHKSEITLDYLLTDPGWLQITTLFMAIGKVTPDRKATELEFITIDSPEAVSFNRARGH